MEQEQSSAVAESARSSSGAAVAVRTCVGCRRRDARAGLLRVVGGTGTAGSGVVLTPDPACSLPGRGAWLHRSGACVDAALRRKAFRRALRVRCEPNPGPLTAYVASSGAALRVGAEHRDALAPRYGVQERKMKKRTDRKS